MLDNKFSACLYLPSLEGFFDDYRMHQLLALATLLITGVRTFAAIYVASFIISEFHTI